MAGSGDTAGKFACKPIEDRLYCFNNSFESSEFVNIRFRDAGNDDLQFIVDIYNSTIPGRMVTADTEAVSVEDRLAWFREHNPEKRPLWIVEYEGEPCAAGLVFSLFTEDRPLMRPPK